MLNGVGVWKLAALLIVLAISLGMGACESSDDGDSVDGDNPDGDGADGDSAGSDGDYELESNPDAEVTISGVSLVENPANMLSAFVEWNSEPASPTYLDVRCGSDVFLQYRNETRSQTHAVFVMSLIGDADCTFTIGAADNEDRWYYEDHAYTVSPLPSFFPEVTINVRKANRMQPGFTLFNLVDSTEEQPVIVAMIDEMGRFRWYHKIQSERPGSDNDVRVVPQGVLVGGTWSGIDARIVDWSGQLVWSDSFIMHHDISLVEPGKLMFLSGREGCTGAAWDAADYYWSGSLHIWDMEQQAVTWSWILCDQYTPPEIVDDWAHLNAIVPFPNENALLISSRDQHSLFKIDMDTELLEWQIGRNGDFNLTSGEWFTRQHAPEFSADNRVLVYDNGNRIEPYKRAYTRVVEIEFDDQTMTSQVVWEYRHDPDLYCDVWGDVDKLSNGDILVTFGREYQPSYLVEVTHDAAKEVVWEAVLPEGWGVYRSVRLENPAESVGIN